MSITCKECGKTLKHLTQSHLKKHSMTNALYKEKYGEDSLNHQDSISYPRKCKCGYIANNPSMWHYHQKTHNEIPKNKLCDGGCGQKAKHRNTNGRYMCNKNSFQCPQYIKEHSTRIKKQWDENEWLERREQVGSIMKNMSEEEKIEYRKNLSKSVNEKYKKIYGKDLSWTVDRKRYNRIVHQLSQKNYKKFRHIINPNKYPIGKFDYHLDHKVSKFVGWSLNIPPEIIAHQDNLEVIHYTDNIKKHINCSADPIELLEKHSDSEKLLIEVNEKWAKIQILLKD